VSAIDVLTVDHTKRDGGSVRRVRRDGSFRARGATANWSRYQRALKLPDHGMVLRCFNCHFVAEFAYRRRQIEASTP
jgi:hypothetical protein